MLKLPSTLRSLAEDFCPPPLPLSALCRCGKTSQLSDLPVWWISSGGQQMTSGEVTRWWMVVTKWWWRQGVTREVFNIPPNWTNLLSASKRTLARWYFSLLYGSVLGGHDRSPGCMFHNNIRCGYHAYKQVTGVDTMHTSRWQYIFFIVFNKKFAMWTLHLQVTTLFSWFSLSS